VEKVWLKNYQKGVPHEINPDVFSSIPDMFEHNTRKFHDKTALINYGSELTYGELDEKSREFAAFLQQDLGMSLCVCFSLSVWMSLSLSV